MNLNFRLFFVRFSYFTMLSAPVQIVLILELLNPAAAVYKFLLSCKEWMALRANVQSDLVFC